MDVGYTRDNAAITTDHRRAQRVNRYTIEIGDDTTPPWRSLPLETHPQPWRPDTRLGAGLGAGLGRARAGRAPAGPLTRPG